MNFDGIGTKIEIAERIGKHSTLAFDLFAMVCDDAARDGGEPVLVGSILDFSKLSVDVVRQLAEGMIEAAKIARVAVVNGDTAELGSRVGGFSENAYNWGAAVVWLAHKERIITGFEIEPGQAVVAVKENGFRSNGLSLVRRVLMEQYGPNWHEYNLDDINLGESVWKDLCYSPLITSFTGGYSGEPVAKVTGIVHITGGGVPGKLARALLASHNGARLQSLFVPFAP